MQVGRFALSAVAAALLGSAGAMAQRGNAVSDIPRELADEIRDGHIFVFRDDTSGYVGRRASALTARYGG